MWGWSGLVTAASAWTKTSWCSGSSRVSRAVSQWRPDPSHSIRYWLTLMVRQAELHRSSESTVNTFEGVPAMTVERAPVEVLKVSATSKPVAVAGAIAGVIRSKGRVEVQAIGAGAINQAVKAVAIS